MDKLPLKHLVKEFQYKGVSNMLQAILKNQAQWLVEYEVLDMSSSKLGQSKWLCVGPSCTIKTLEDAEKHRVDIELASTTKWPVRYIEVCDPWDDDLAILMSSRTAALCALLYERHSAPCGDREPVVSVLGDSLWDEVDRLEADTDLQRSTRRGCEAIINTAPKALAREFAWVKEL
jgi:hypothetical protein